MKSALDLIRLAAESPLQSRFQVRSIDLTKGYCMVVTNQSRAQITFGLDRVESQLERLAIFLDRIEQNRRELRAINLMVQRNVPVVYAPLEEAVQAEATTPETTPDMNSSTAKKADSLKEKWKASAGGKASPTPSKGTKSPTVRKAIPVGTSRNLNR